MKARRRTRPLRIALAALVAALLPLAARAAPLNLAALSCNKYENEILPAAGGGTDVASSPDAINMVMWLFGYSVGKAGDHVMYGDALSSFGFALDAECKNQPSMSLLEALTAVSPKHDKPMDLVNLTCGAFETRHTETARTDPDSATTIMMWLYGFSVGRAGSHLFDVDALGAFITALNTECGRHPEESLFDALGASGKSPHR